MKLRDWLILLFWNTFPMILVHLIARAYWSNNRAEDNTSVAVFETLFTMFILPICLLLANFLIDKFQAMNRLGVWGIMVFSLSLSTLLGFKNWADKVGSWRHPDPETISVVQLKFFIGFLIVGIITLISFVKKRGG